MFDGNEVISNKNENLRGKINILFERNNVLKAHPLLTHKG